MYTYHCRSVHVSILIHLPPELWENSVYNSLGNTNILICFSSWRSAPFSAHGESLRTATAPVGAKSFPAGTMDFRRPYKHGNPTSPFEGANAKRGRA